MDPRSPKEPPKDETAARLRENLGCEFCLGTGEDSERKWHRCPHCELPLLRSVIAAML
jgi:hypothetical protein